jgi:DNA-binding protein H-NS
VPSFQYVFASQYFDMQTITLFYRPPSAHDVVGVGESNHGWGAIMKRSDLETMSSQELWLLHQKVMATFTAKIIAQKKVLEDRLSQLNRRFRVEQTSETPERRSYPTVFPKYRNPAEPSETWAGRGKKPRWLTAQLKSGKQIDDFRIDLAAA